MLSQDSIQREMTPKVMKWWRSELGHDDLKDSEARTLNSTIWIEEPLAERHSFFHWTMINPTSLQHAYKTKNSSHDEDD
jgi:hypothetical protein